MNNAAIENEMETIKNVFLCIHTLLSPLQSDSNYLFAP